MSSFRRKRNLNCAKMFFLNFSTSVICGTKEITKIVWCCFYFIERFLYQRVKIDGNGDVAMKIIGLKNLWWLGKLQMLLRFSQSFQRIVFYFRRCKINFRFNRWRFQRRLNNFSKCNCELGAMRPWTKTNN